MDIKWLRTFIVAAKHENFRKTSEELFLTQPAITKHIKRLEEYLNISLFRRNGKTVTLTSAGYKFLPYAKEFLTKYEQGMGSFESWKQGYNKRLTIAAAPQIASSFLPVLLRAFINNNPNIEVFINVMKSFEIGEEISTGKADVGLTRIKPAQPHLEVEMVQEEPVLLVAPYVTEQGNHTEEEVLTKYRLITHNHPDYWEALLHDVKRHYPMVKTMVVNQIEVTKRFIENGLGVSYLPYSIVKEEIKRKSLTEIKAEKVLSPISSTYLVTKTETEEVRSFIVFLREFF